MNITASRRSHPMFRLGAICLLAALLLILALPAGAQEPPQHTPTPPPVSGSVTGPRATFERSTTTTMTITWPVIANADGYEVRMAHPEFSGWDKVTGGSTRTHTITDLKPASQYSFQVRATQGGARSKNGLHAVGFTKPNTPTNLRYTFEGTTLKVYWNRVAAGGSGFQQYVPTYEARVGSGAWADVGNNASHDFADQTLSTNIAVDVRAKVSSAGVADAHSANASLQANSDNVPGDPGSPTTSAVTATSAKLSWTASSGTVTTYHVQRNSSRWFDSTNADTEHDFDNLNENTEYILRVRARNGPAMSAISAASAVTTPPSAAPGAPDSPVATATSSASITLTWTASSGVVDTYEVSKDGGTTWVDAGDDTEHIFSGLTANTSYTLQVRAVNRVGPSPVASADPVKTLPESAPGDPGSPTATATSASSITLSWTASTGAVDTYEASKDGTNWVDAGGDDTEYVFTGLDANTAYTLQVRAVNRVGTSGAVSAAAVTTFPAAAPAAPGSPTTSAVSASSITLSWTASTGLVDTYEVSSNGTDWVDAGDDTEHIFTGLSANTSYTLQVRAKNRAGNSAAVSAAAVKTLPNAPASPVTSAISASGMTLSWTASVGGADTYLVSKDGGTTWEDSGGGDTTHTFTGLDGNTAYTLQVKANNASGDSTVASAAAVKTLPNAPTSPVAVANSATALTLSWTASVGGADTYLVSKDGTNFVDSGSDTTHAFSGLSANTAYTLQVKAKNASGESAAVSAASVNTLPAGVPGTPGSPTTSAISASSITLSWTASTGVVDTYEVSKDVTDDDSWVDSGGGDTTHTFSGLTANTAYTLAVRAKNAIGESGVASAAEVKTFPAAAPAAPGSPTTSAVSANSITLTWTASTGVVDTYEVSSNGTDWVDSGGGGTTHTFTGLSANTAYTLQVKAKNRAGESAAVSAAAVKTLPNPPASPVTSAITASGMTLSWTASAGGADTYLVSKDGGTTWIDSSNTDTTHAFTGLDGNTAYTLQVKAKNASGDSTVASAAEVKTLPNPPASPVAVTDSATALTLSWTASAGGADTYLVSKDGGTTWVDSGGGDTEHEFTGLTANSAYTLQVKAKNASGESAAVSAAAKKTLPNPPTSPVTSAITASGMTLSWTASVGGADTYLVSKDGGSTWIDSSNADTTHAFTGLDANTAYTLQVKANNASGDSTVASAAAVKTLPNAPASPVAVADSASAITLSWTASVGGADTYLVSKDGGSTWVDSGGGDTEHEFTGLTANSAYTLQVKAKNASGESAAVSAAAVKTLPAGVPGTPGSPTTSAISASSITLSWTVSTGVVDTYEVSSNGTDWVDSGGGDTEHIFTGLTANTAYTLHVRAKNAIGASAAASAAEVKTWPAAAPGVPGSPLTSAISASSITLSWTASSGVVDTYLVSSNGTDWVDSGGGDTSHTFTGLTANTAYTLQVKAKNRVGESGITSAAQVTTLPAAAPGVPGSPQTSAISASSITLSWTASTGVVDTYLVSSNGTDWVDSGGGDTSHTFTGLTASTAYTLRVRAKNRAGESGISAAAQVSTLAAAPGAPNPPTSPVTSAITANGMTLSWTASVGGADTYLVSNDGATWVDAGGGDTTHAFTGLDANTEYTLQVKAEKASVESAAVSAAAKKTLPNPPTSPVTSAITASGMTLSWTASVGGADTYLVSKDGGATWIDAGGGDTEHIFNDLDGNTAYTLQVKAQNASGDSAAVSAAAVKTLPNAPTVPTATATSASVITLSWTASVGGADTYLVSKDNGATWIDAGGGDTEHEFTGLTANTAYTLQVKAKNASGESAVASAPSVTTWPSAAPGAPASPSTSNITANSITLTWTASTGVVDTYEVSQDNGANWVDAGGDDTEHIFRNLSASTAYTLSVRATNRAGNSAAVSAAAATTLPAGSDALPDKPSPFTTSDVQSNSVTVTWGSADGAESYQVQGWMVPDQPASQARAGGILNDWLDVGMNTAYTFTSLNPNSQYEFGVHAMNKMGASDDAMLTVQTKADVQSDRSDSEGSSDLSENVGLPSRDSETSGSGGSGDSGSGREPRATATYLPATPVQTLNDLPDEIVVRHWLDGAQGRRVGALEISDPALSRQGIVDAIDLWGYVTPGVEVCFRRSGAALVFLDAATAPRAKLSWLGYPSSGMTCTIIDRPGTVVLLASASADGSIQPASTLLSNCVVELTEYLNLRESPWGAVIQILAPGIRLTAEEYANGWFKVDFYGRKGWIIGDSVIPIGACSPPPPPAPVVATAQPLATAIPDSSALSNCLVELTEFLNFREAPWGDIMRVLAPGIQLTAVEYQDGWYKVDFYGEKGWLAEDYLVPIGSC